MTYIFPHFRLYHLIFTYFWITYIFRFQLVYFYFGERKNKSSMIIYLNNIIKIIKIDWIIFI
jgi:hypothetical protein